MASKNTGPWTGSKAHQKFQLFDNPKPDSFLEEAAKVGGFGHSLQLSTLYFLFLSLQPNSKDVSANHNQKKPACYFALVTTEHSFGQCLLLAYHGAFHKNYQKNAISSHPDSKVLTNVGVCLGMLMWSYVGFCWRWRHLRD